MSSRPALPGPRLLVPVSVEALVLTRPRRAGDWAAHRPDYAGLAHGAPAEPEPFTEAGWGDFTGVVVRWTLPDALTQGEQNPRTAATEFPAVPNRWLVLRRSWPADDAAPETTGWLVQSDYLGPPVPPGAPAEQGSTAAGRPWPPTNDLRLGRVFDLAAWPGESGIDRAQTLRGRGLGPLTAVGAGASAAEPAFAAFVPGAVNIFALRDPLAGPGPRLLTYLVVGWYADRADDPLPRSRRATRADWQALLARFGWTVAGDPRLDALLAAAPRGLLCHGVVHSVPWPGVDRGEIDDTRPWVKGLALDGVPSASRGAAPVVAVGRTAAEALAAYLQRGLHPAGDAAPDFNLALQALQQQRLDTLKRADGRGQLARAVHDAAFSPRPGGITWTLAGEAGAPPPMAAGTGALLDALNAAQAQLEHAEAALADGQARLYEAWWLLRRLTAPGKRPAGVRRPTLERQQRRLREEVAGLLARRAEAVQARDAARVALEAQLAPVVPVPQRAAGAGAPGAGTPGAGTPPPGGLPPAATLRVIPQPRPSYWQPSAPVVLLAGVGRSYVHGEDGRFTATGVLVCRLPRQVITRRSITLPPAAGRTTRRTVRLDAARLGTTLPLGVALPAEVGALWAEALLLDRSAVPWLARVAFEQGGSDDVAPAVRAAAADRLGAQLDALWLPSLAPAAPLDVRKLVQAAGLAGVLPSKVAVSQWQAPWDPLFLEWQLDWRESGRDDAAERCDPPAALAAWTFDGADYTAGTSAAVPPPAAGQQIMGRALLTPGVARVLAARLAAAAGGAAGAAPGAGAPASRAASGPSAVADWQLLSQALSDFGDTLLTLDSRPHARPGPADPDAALLAGAQLAAPRPDAAFCPLAAGHFRLARLRVVDAFGQTLDPLAPSSPAAGSPPPAPLIPPALDAGNGLVRFAPRLFHPARLAFEPVDGGIVGWLAPATGGLGLAVYEATGRLLGELLETADAAGGAAWFPAAGAPETAVSPADAHLRGLIAGLLDRPDSGAALDDLLCVCEDVRWTVDPAGGVGGAPAERAAAGNGGALLALTGAAIAVVRAQLRLELQGSGPRSSSWGANSEAVDSLEDVAFPVRLGALDLLDDGLFGFFLDGPAGPDYTRCYTPYPLAQGAPEGAPEAALPDAPADPFDPARLHAVHPSRADPPYLAQRDLALRFAPDSAATVTLLFDPASTVHAASGILPVAELALPAGQVSAALAGLEIALHCGPVLLPADLDGTPRAALPLPQVERGAWEWLDAQLAAPLPAAPADLLARLVDAPPVVGEGWLRWLRR